MAENIEMLGVDEINAKLKQLNTQANRVENRAIREGAKMLQEAIGRKAPRSTSPRQPTSPSQKWRTGQHAGDNIKISNVRKDRNGKYALVGVQKRDNSRYFYLKFHEWGTTKMPAQPFMEPTAQEMQEQVLAKIREELKAGLGL